MVVVYLLISYYFRSGVSTSAGNGIHDFYDYLLLKTGKISTTLPAMYVTPLLIQGDKIVTLLHPIAIFFYTAKKL